MMILSMTGALALLPVAQSPNTPYLYMIVLGYWLMNIAYCIRLKQYAILDVSIIAIGFDACIGRWRHNGHLDFPLAGDADLPCDSFSGFH